ncbi:MULTISPECIES: HlyD family secretion protein [Pseudomonas]|uniref:HlyD family secretion protein n=1 Tax=Pseudomonas nitroreducens TaxID=46680 RepID=UPI001E4661DC|nr:MULTISPECIES: HlyD family secretion protein [Pseudomonas]MCE4072429.1 HlyD family secretion protein [Pseudomonas nitritireducens]MCE4081706.1 HlyD family secretion protein [Pseudomonas nitroreducens]
MNIAVDDQQAESAERAAQVDRKRNQRRLLWLGGGALVVAALGYGLYWASVGRYLEETDDAYVRADWITISPKVSGYVAEVLVDDNQKVAAGTPLVRIQPRDYQARLLQARARQAEARAAISAQQAALVTLDAQLKEQQALIDQAAADVDSTRAERQRAQLDFQRYRDLVAQQAASSQRLESVTADFARARSAVSRAEAAASRQRTRLGVLQASRDQALALLAQQQARAAEADASLTLAEHEEEDTLIRAPIAGVVGQRRVRQRQYVTPGLPLLALVPVEQSYVVANYKETQLRRMRPGQPVEVRVDSFPQVVLHGRVDGFSPGSGALFALLPPDNATGNFTKIVQRFPVKIALAADARQQVPILPGMSVIAEVDTRQDSEAGRHDQ